MVEILRHPLRSVSCHLFLSSWNLTIIDNLLVDFQFINTDDVSVTLKFNTLNKIKEFSLLTQQFKEGKRKKRNQMKIYLMSFWLWIFFFTNSHSLFLLKKSPKKCSRFFFSFSVCCDMRKNMKRRKPPFV